MQQQGSFKKQHKTIYRCRKCRQQLFNQIIHSEEKCTSYFIEKPQWLNVDHMENDMKLDCPKCKTKIGQIIFSGKKCSCSKWITPAYQIIKSKVDAIKVL